MNELIILIGIPGSGKSTWALNWVKESSKNRVRINWDSLREMFGQYWVPSREHLVVSSSNMIVEEAMKGGFDIVIDNMNLGGSEKYKELAEKYGYQVSEKIFDVSLETCIARDKSRERVIGEDIIKILYNKFKDRYGKRA